MIRLLLVYLKFDMESASQTRVNNNVTRVVHLASKVEAQAVSHVTQDTYYISIHALIIVLPQPILYQPISIQQLKKR